MSTPLDTKLYRALFGEKQSTGHIRWDNGNDDFWGHCFWDSHWPETSIIPDGMIEAVRSLAASYSRMLHSLTKAAEVLQQAGYTFVDDSDE